MKITYEIIKPLYFKFLCKNQVIPWRLCISQIMYATFLTTSTF